MIVGKDGVIDSAIIALLCRGHILVEDVPGIGKTTLSKVLAQSLGCSFKRIQFTPDLMPTDVIGVNFFNQKTGDFELRPGPIFAQVVLADEINRATPRTQSALLEAMQERQSTIDGVSSALPEPFIVIATQNPIEMEGTFPLPEAQLDRFMVNVEIGYPSPEEESDILLRFEEDTIPPPGRRGDERGRVEGDAAAGAPRARGRHGARVRRERHAEDPRAREPLIGGQPPGRARPLQDVAGRGRH